jgi:hypothetical protein
MTQGNPQSTGRSKFKGPEVGTVAWVAPLHYSRGEVVAVADSSIVAGGVDGLFAYSSVGAPRRTFEDHWGAVQASWKAYLLIVKPKTVLRLRYRGASGRIRRRIVRIKRRFHDPSFASRHPGGQR